MADTILWCKLLVSTVLVTNFIWKTNTLRKSIQTVEWNKGRSRPHSKHSDDHAFHRWIDRCSQCTGYCLDDHSSHNSHGMRYNTNQEPNDPHLIVAICCYSMWLTMCCFAIPQIALLHSICTETEISIIKFLCFFQTCILDFDFQNGIDLVSNWESRIQKAEKWLTLCCIMSMAFVRVSSTP